MMEEEIRSGPADAPSAGSGQALRTRAEEIAREKGTRMPDNIEALTAKQARQVHHELQVHQIELEMQNEELRGTQARLEASRARYFDLYDLAPVGYFTVSEQGLILEANLTAATLLGVARGALVKRPLSHFIFPEDQDIYYRSRKTLFETVAPQVCEVRLLRKDGAQFWSRLEATVAQDAEGASVSRVVVSDITERRRVEAELARHREHLEQLVSERTVELKRVNEELRTDIARRKRAEEALRASENRYRALVENISLGITLIDRNHRVVLANAAQGELFHKPPGAFAGKRCFEEFEKRDSVCAHCPGTRVLATGEPADAESEGVRDDGSRFSVRIQAFPVPGADGRANGFITVVEDVTEQKRMEEQYDHAQRMEAVGRLAGGVAHDIRNQLMVIQYGAETLLEKSSTEDEQQATLRSILEAVDRSASTTARLLAFARKQPLRPEIVRAGEQVASLGKSLHRMIGEDISLSVVLGHGPCYVNVDPAELQHAVTNLVVNARDAMPGGGELTIVTSDVVLDAITVQGHPEAEPGRYVTVAVTDTGCGMSEDVRNQAFNPFFTTKEVGRGTGLGLSLVYGFARQSGGFVELQSEPGKGTTVTLCFPLADAPGMSARDASKKEDTPRGTETLLLVEDEEPVRKLLTQQLKGLGYTLLVAANPEDALSQLEKHAGRLDLLVTDVVMPRGSGVELARRVRAARPGLPVLYVSGYAGDELARRGIAEMESNLLLKPFTGRELAQSIRDALAAGPRTHGAQ